MNARTWEGAQVALLDVDAVIDARIDRSRAGAKARIAAGACSGCAARPARPGLKTCESCSKKTPRARKPGAFLIVVGAGDAWQGPTLLEASDDDAEGVFRRDADCARRTACEDDWIERANASGDIGTQARCPAVCACYSNRWRQVL